MKKTLFGKMPDGKEVFLYTMENKHIKVNVLEYGCRIQSLLFDGRDMVGGFDTLDAYLEDDSSQGAFVGRVANRIRNARFALNGKTYQLKPNEKNNHLHGSFALSLWAAEFVDEHTLKLTRTSPSKEEGYPGNIDVTVLYQLDSNSLKMTYYAVADEDTPVNFTNHSYFNIDGIGSGSIMGQEMQISADRITVVDAELLPTGERRDVAGTAYDFREYHVIGSRCNDEIDGYDTNFWLTGKSAEKFGDKTLCHAVSLRSSSYQVDCYTDLPCIQIYTGNFLGNGPDFKYGIPQEKQHAVCLETQFEPDCVNRGEGILRKGEVYDHTTVYRFTHK